MVFHFHRYRGTTYRKAGGPFRYRGYYYDTETGLYYLNARYYDPSIGRFISEDSLVTAVNGVLGHNVYAYCCNNSVGFSDPSGFGRLTKAEQEELNRLRALRDSAESYEEKYAYALAMDRISPIGHVNNVYCPYKVNLPLSIAAVSGSGNGAVYKVLYIEVGGLGSMPTHIEAGFASVGYDAERWGFSVDVLHVYGGVELAGGQWAGFSAELFTISAYGYVSDHLAVEPTFGIGYDVTRNLTEKQLYPEEMFRGSGLIFNARLVKKR